MCAGELTDGQWAFIAAMEVALTPEPPRRPGTSFLTEDGQWAMEVDVGDDGNRPADDVDD